VQLFAGVFLVDPKGRLLLQERDEHPVIDPLKWGLVGGHVDPGEEFEPAAYRELQEETEVVATPGSLKLWREYDVWHEAYSSTDRMQVFAASTTLTDADIVCHEGRQIVFVDPEVARGLDLTSAAGRIVPEFLDSELYQSLRDATVHRVASVALIDPRGWLLMQERDEFPEIDPEKWGFPGGGVEEGEDFETAAHRELTEETGVRLERLEPLGEFSFWSEPCGADDVFGLYAARVDLTDADIECHEGRQMVFVDPDVVATLDLTRSAEVALPLVLASDLYRGVVSG